MMSKASEKLLHYTMPNDRKPDYFSYHKYSALNLLCKNEDIPSGLDQNLLSGSEICQFHGSESTFSDSIVEDLSNVKRERLQMLLKQSVACLNQEIDEAFEDLEVLMNVGLDGQKAIDNYFSVAFEELEVMEQNLEEYLNILASKCRQVTAAEREMLGQWIRSLPAKALGRVVEIIHCRHSSEKRLPDKIHVDLEKEVFQQMTAAMVRLMLSYYLIFLRVFFHQLPRIRPRCGGCISTSKMLRASIIFKNRQRNVHALRCVRRTH